MHRDLILRELPFAKFDQDRLNLWNMPRDLAWGQACQLGRESADQLVRFMMRHDDPAILLRVSQHIIASGRYDGINAGFGQRLSERLILVK